jgi:uncharacterized protein (DUF1501 family)
MNPYNASRRRFIKDSGALSAASLVAPSLLMNLSAIADAAAASSNTYKALVCIFLSGGNDAFGTVLPGDDLTWQTYQTKRAKLMRARADYIAINKSPTDATSFLLHPNLSEVGTLYKAKKLSIVGNVGPLRAPTDRSSYTSNTVSKPPKLFSHNDQTSIWQTGMPDGALAEGWGGGLLVKAAQTSVDSAKAGNIFAAVGVNSTPPFLGARAATYSATSQEIKPFGIGPNGGLPLSDAYETSSLFNYFNTNRLTAAWSGAYKTLTHEMQRDVASVATRSSASWQILRGENLAPIATYTDSRAPRGDLQGQLRVVADMIKATGSATMGIERQVFFVQLGGFDTHTGQVARQNDLLTELSAALAYFDALLGADRDKVTTFTASDFGRKLQANADGTDHGWGGHHFVMGGVVSGDKGGKVLGHFPDLTALDSNGKYIDPQMLEDGTLIPKVPVSNYLKPIATWFGVADFDGLWKSLDKEITLPQAGFSTVSFA